MTRLLSILCAIVAATHAGAAIIAVPTDAPTVQAAIDLATDGDEIVILPGTYDEKLNTLGKSITLRSTDPSDPTVVDTTVLYSFEEFGHVITIPDIEPSTVEIDGLTITRTIGVTSRRGGAIYVADRNTLKLRRSNISRNEPISTGAIRIEFFCNVTIESCRFERNLGSTADIFSFSTLSMKDCHFIGSQFFQGRSVAVIGYEGTTSALRCFFTGYRNDTTIVVLSSFAAEAIDCAFYNNNCWSGAVLELFGLETSVTGCEFVSNSTGGPNGGAMRASDDIEIIDSVFRDNTSTTRGAAINIGISITARIEGCRFLRNSSELGGAISVSTNESTVITDCSFENNEAIEGGAIALASHFVINARVERCRFIGNSADTGGAIDLNNRTLTLTDCLFNNNTATLGGALRLNNARLTMSNCTLVNNTGYGIHATNDNGSLISNSIYWGNEPVFIGLIGNTFPYVRNSIVEIGYFAPSEGVLTADPLFSNATDGNYTLAPGSPAIDAGFNPDVPATATTDLNGLPRILDDPATPDTGAGDAPVVDIGAHEFVGAQSPCLGDCDTSGAVDFNDLIAILFALGETDTPACDTDRSGAITFDDLAATLFLLGPCASP